jgi:Outer membrane receptor for ferrienterochelin and colicins
MIKKTLLPLVLVLALPMLLSAQSMTISGYVSEKKSAERIIGGIVFAPQKGIGTATNSFGFYSITIPHATDSVKLRVSYVGYGTQEFTLAPGASRSLNIEMEPENEMKEVVVTAEKDELHTRTQMSSIDLPINTIKSLPAFLGEADIMKAIQLLPGIQGGSEGSTGIYVRGGGPDQNLILLDGVPVYNASHIFGFMSVFNADAVKSVEVIKGGFPARYGGRLSSVIDINMKEGDKNKIHGEGGIGLVASRLMLEGPIQKGKSSFMVSGRRTYIDFIMRPIIKQSTDDNLTTGYYFYDLNAKLNFKLTEKDHLYISGYFGNDKFYSNLKEDGVDDLSSKNDLKWGNITAVARWNHQFSHKLFGNLTTYYSRYRFIISSQQKENFSMGGGSSFLLQYNSGIDDKTIKYDLDYLPGGNHYIKTGVSYVAHRYSPGALQTKLTDLTLAADTTLGNEALDAGELDAYIEDDIRLTDKLKANIGLHWTGFWVRGKMYNALQPRIALRYLITDRLSAKASFVQMNQFINLLTNTTVGLPTDLWVPVTDRAPMQTSYQGAAGLAYTHHTGIEMSVEGYYKTMENVLEYKEGASFFNATTGWEDKIEIGKGKSYGAELFLQKQKGRFTGMMGYTLSYTTRQFDNLNNGEEFSYRYDRRHDFKIAGIYNLSKRIELSAEWVYGTGNAITMPLGVYQGQDDNVVEVYGSRNDYRMAPYHRGDVSIKFTKEKKRFTRAWVLACYNVYNRQNPFYIQRDTDAMGKTVFKQVSLFPIIPSISYQFKF